MDKKIKNRDIGFDPRKGIIPAIKTARAAAKPEKPIKLKEIPPPKKLAKVEKAPVTAKELCEWLNTHTYLNLTKICDEVGQDRGNFQRKLKEESPVMKPEVIEKMVKILKNYGFQQTSK